MQVPARVWRRLVSQRAPAIRRDTGGRVGLDSVIRFLGDELLVMQLSGVSVV